MEKKRLWGIDLVKTIGIFFVVSVHFFLNSGYYNTPMSGKTMMITTVFRWLFFSCVPLFLLSTGFLRCKKEPTKKYYISIIPIYISCIIIGIFSIVIKNIYIEKTSLFSSVQDILRLKSGYLWYMEMFIGFSLLIPFLNIIYNNIKKPHKHFLIVIFLLLTTICYFSSDYWVILYPFTYYFIGAYINEYRPKINKTAGIFILALITLFEGLYTYFKCRNQLFNWSIFGGNGGLFPMFSAILIFLIFYDTEIKNGFFEKLITDISGKTLDIYIVSYIFDFFIYKELDKDYLKLVPYAPLIVLTVFLLSYLYSSIKKPIFDIIFKKKKMEKNEI